MPAQWSAAICIKAMFSKSLHEMGDQGISTPVMKGFAASSGVTTCHHTCTLDMLTEVNHLTGCMHGLFDSATGRQQKQQLAYMPRM